MADKTSTQTDGVARVTLRSRIGGATMEFFLVLFFLIALVTLVGVVLWMPADYITGSYDSEPAEIIEFKKELLAILLTAFGAWIGAGAAYFFGRENFREAVKGIKEAQAQKSVDEILRGTKVRDLPLRAPKFVVGPDTRVGEVADRIWKNKNEWFFVIVDDGGKYIASIHEEVIWRLRADPGALISGAAWPSISDMGLGIVLWAAASDDLEHGAFEQRDLTPEDFAVIKEKFDIAEPFSLDADIRTVEAALNEQKKYIGVVVDSEKKPTGYFSTGDIRHILTGGAR